MRPHIARALSNGYAAGAILSPADLGARLLSETADEVRAAGGTVAIDPQTVTLGILDCNPKKLLEHQHLPGVGLRARDVDATAITSLVENALALQNEHGASVLLSPTVALDSLDHRWAQVAANLAMASIDHWDADNDPALFISVSLTQQFLTQQDEVDDLLDELTRYDVPGFYLIGEVNALGQRQVAERSALGLLQVVQGLSSAGYRVWVGYGGLASIALRAAGAEATASGWFFKQQWWSPEHWLSASGGQTPPARVTLEALLSEPRWATDVDDLLRLRRRRPDLTAAAFAGAGATAGRLTAARALPDEPDRSDLVEQHLTTLHALDSAVPTAADARPDHALRVFEQAERLHRELRDEGVRFSDLRAGPGRIEVWRYALNELVS